jgi:CRISPR-associated protein Csm1
MSEFNTRSLVYLASLIHDIGKFYQRADNNQLRNSVLPDQEIKNLEAAYCPVFQGLHSHKHVLWTAQFIAEHEPMFKALSGNLFSLFFKAAVGHHRPGEMEEEQMVQKADYYASGIDRNKGAFEDAAAEAEWDQFKTGRMVSVFEHLLSDQSSPTYQYALPTKALRLDNSVFPKPSAQADPADYKTLWQDFSAEFLRLDTKHFRSFQHTLTQLLHKYLVHVPSGSVDLPDVSLYDHLKSTAAFSVCLWDYLQEMKKPVSSINGNDEPVLLVGGDISGIQKFIYDIVSSDAAKNLKGRSFYLQLLSESISDRLIQVLDLFSTNVVYASGGSFYLLAPNTPKIRQQIAEFRSVLEAELFEAHGTRLSVSLDYVPVSQEAIFRQEIQLCWKSLSEKLSASKRRKHADLLRLNYRRFFDPSEVGGQQARDFITGEELSIQELSDQKFRIQTGDGHKPVGKYTWLQIQLGKHLRKAKALAVAQHPLTNLKNTFSFQIPADPRTYYLLQEDWSPQSSEGVEIRRLNDLEFLDGSFQGNGISSGFTFYGGNRFPVGEDGGPLTFDELTETESGLKRLGVLRMDVDNLGSVFIDGLGQGKRTFSRYAAISRSLDLFFRGWLNALWESRAEFQKHTYIVYSGGDDLFIVGKWDTLINMAEEIQKGFKAYTCNNPRLSLSGGVALVNSRFPISKAAVFAEQAEKAAKRHEIQRKDYHDKNAFTFLDFPLHWEEEWPLVKQWKAQLIENIQENPRLPKALLRKIIQFDEMREWQIENKTGESWRWLMAYDFARAAERSREREREYVVKLLHTLKNDIMTDTVYGRKTPSGYPSLKLLRIAARWAEMELRN